MATYKTKAIILSSYPYKEHDRIVTFFSEEFGKIDARARGSRKIISKLAGHLEPFVETELLLANGRRWDIIAGSRTIQAQSRIRSSVEFTSSASVCVEAVKHITKPQSYEPNVYDLLNRVLHYLDTDANIKEMPQLVSTFLWRLLTISGFKAELDQCINCRDKVHSGMFSFEGGGMLCPNCKNRDALGVDVSENLLIKLQKSDLQEKAAQSIATRFWKRIVDHNILHSLNFFEILHNYETQR